MKFCTPPFTIVATDAGAGPVIALIVAVPPAVNAAGATLLKVTPVLLVTRMVKVTVSPLNTQTGAGGVAVKSAIKHDAVVTVITDDVIVRDVLVPPLSRADAVNEIVPMFGPVLYTQLSVPVAPGARFKLAGLDVEVAVGLPLNTFKVGGLGTDVTAVRLAVERLVTCIVNVNEPTQLRATLNDEGVNVITNALSVQLG